MEILLSCSFMTLYRSPFASVVSCEGKRPGVTVLTRMPRSRKALARSPRMWLCAALDCAYEYSHTSLLSAGGGVLEPTYLLRNMDSAAIELIIQMLGLADF